MKNRWSENDAAAFIQQCGQDTARDISLRTYTTRLLGLESDLVLHGGGNTSVKSSLINVLGQEVPALFVKASGGDMASIGPDGFVPLDLDYLLKLRSLPAFPDEDMADEFRMHRLQARDILPSVETLLHAFLPAKFIDHTHPAAILALTNRADGEAIVREALGDGIVFLPYVKAGGELAHAVADVFQTNPGARAMVLGHHGLITWGETAQLAYETTIDLVNRAEDHLKKNKTRTLATKSPVSIPRAEARYLKIAPLLRGILAGQPAPQDDPAGVTDRIILQPLIREDILRILESESGKELACSPPLTPDHLIRTKALPLWLDEPDYKNESALRDQILKGLAHYTAQYKSYVERHAGRIRGGTAGFDAMPKVIVLPGVGLVCAGTDSVGAGIARDIAAQTLLVKAAIYESGGKYQGLTEEHLFDMEYHSFQRAKLERTTTGPLTGSVALVTGAAGAIGSAICQALLDAGCNVACTDLAGESLDALTQTLSADLPNRALGIAMDVTDPVSVKQGFDAAISAWGGVDLVVSNAGLAHVSLLAEMDLEKFRKLERVNVDGTLLVLREAARRFQSQNTGGDIVLISTKNVFAPGATFGAYSATKAAAHQLARIASLELAAINVRVNMVAPDAVFSHGSKKSGLWQEVGPDRMRARGLDEKGLEEYYRQRNLLKVKVTGSHVANAVLFFATHQTPTTGATLPVDGGLPDATPR